MRVSYKESANMISYYMVSLSLSLSLSLSSLSHLSLISLSYMHIHWCSLKKAK